MITGSQRQRHCALAAGVAFNALLLAAYGAHAAEPPASATSVSELVVTAQKRSESIARVPLAITALTGNQIVERNYRTISDMTSAIPNVNVVTNNGNASIESRGIWQQTGLAAGDAAVSFFVNGVLEPHVQDDAFSFYDVARLEVLKGPQGTLYGYNSIGGAVNVITNMPTDNFEASEIVSYGNYAAITTRTVLSGPVLPNLFVRLAVATDNHDGYSLNLFDGKRDDNQNVNSERLTIVWKPTNSLTFTTIADYNSENDNAYATHNGGVAIPGTILQGVMLGGSALPVDANGMTIDPQLLDDYVDPVAKRQSWGIAETIAWQLSQSISLKSISSYRHLDNYFCTDFLGTTFPFPATPQCNTVQTAYYHYLSQEFQLTGSTDRFNWVAGLYYLHDILTSGGTDFGLSPAPGVLAADSGGSEAKNAYAAYGQATYQVTHKLGLTVGLRESYETVSIDATKKLNGVVRVGPASCAYLPGGICHQVASTSFNSFTPRAEVHYQWTDRIMTYASVTRGAESGGFSIEDLQPAYLPATATAYEIGLKAFGDRWSANIAAFHTDYANIQVEKVVDNISTTVNAAAAKVDGAEFELMVKPLRGVTITDALALLDPRYTNYTELNTNFPFTGPNGMVNLAGNQLQNSHKFTNNLRVAYEIPLGEYSLEISGDWNYRSRIFFNEYNDLIESQAANSIFDAAIRFNSNARWWVELYGKNLSNRLILEQTSIGGCGCLNSQFEPPRTYGVTLGVKY
jgi:iron complex outermembrane receptor protein